jgi:hypothetical protein
MFPLLHFLLPPGEEDRGEDVHREMQGGFVYAGFVFP